MFCPHPKHRRWNKREKPSCMSDLWEFELVSYWICCHCTVYCIENDFIICHLGPSWCTKAKFKFNINRKKIWLENSPEYVSLQGFKWLFKYIAMLYHSFKMIFSDACGLIKWSILSFSQLSELHIKLITEQLKLLKKNWSHGLDAMLNIVFLI